MRPATEAASAKGPGATEHKPTSRLDRDRWQHLAGVGPLLIFGLVFVVLPLGTLFVYSLGTSTFVDLRLGFNPGNYLDALADPLYRTLLGRSLLIGFITATLCVLLAFPFAFAITLGRQRHRGEVLLLLVLVSLFCSYVVRIYAWRTLLGDTGVINSGLGELGIGPAEFLLYSRFGVVLTLVNVLLPLAILPIYSALAQIDPSLIESARNLGSTYLGAVWKVVVPLASRGINTAFAICLFIAAGDYVTPQLVGGASSQMLGNVINDQFGVAYNWPLGGTLAFVLLLSMTLVVGTWLLLGRFLGIRGALR